MLRQPGSTRRTAFTLIELLIVLAIIATIVSLTLAAVQAIIVGQEKKTTELTIKRTDEGRIAHWRAVLDQAKELPVPNSVLAIAGGDPRRAKVIWQKLQLKRQFPMTFREALYPWAVDGNNASPSPISAADLPPVDAYVKAIAAFVAATGGYAPVGTYSSDESSHLLFLALSMNRRGVDYNIEQALGTLAIYQDPPGEGSLRGFKDAWNQPVVFFRWPTDFPDYRAITSGDPQDPERTLLDVNWNNATNQATNGLVYWFEQLCHPIHNPTTGAAEAFYAQPTIVSGGPNKRLGLLLTPSNTVSPNFGMALDTVNDPQGANDNIYSTTLK